MKRHSIPFVNPFLARGPHSIPFFTSLLSSHLSLSPADRISHFFPFRPEFNADFASSYAHTIFSLSAIWVISFSPPVKRRRISWKPERGEKSNYPAKLTPPPLLLPLPNRTHVFNFRPYRWELAPPSERDLAKWKSSTLSWFPFPEKCELCLLALLSLHFFELGSPGNGMRKYNLMGQTEHKSVNLESRGSRKKSLCGGEVKVCEKKYTKKAWCGFGKTGWVRDKKRRKDRGPCMVSKPKICPSPHALSLPISSLAFIRKIFIHDAPLLWGKVGCVWKLWERKIY